MKRLIVLLLVVGLITANNIDFPNPYGKIVKKSHILKLIISNESVIEEDSVTHMYMKYSLLNITNNFATRTFKNYNSVVNMPMFPPYWTVYKINKIIIAGDKMKVTYANTPLTSSFTLKEKQSEFVLIRMPTFKYNCVWWFNNETNETITPFPKTRCA